MCDFNSFLTALVYFQIIELDFPLYWIVSVILSVHETSNIKACFQYFQTRLCEANIQSFAILVKKIQFY